MPKQIFKPENLSAPIDRIVHESMQEEQNLLDEEDYKKACICELNRSMLVLNGWERCPDCGRSLQCTKT